REWLIHRDWVPEPHVSLPAPGKKKRSRLRARARDQAGEGPRAAWGLLQGLKSRLLSDGGLFLLCDFESGFRPLKRVFGASEILFCLPIVQCFFGAPFRLLGPLDVDLLRTLGGFRKDRHFVRKHLGEAPGDCQIIGLVTLAIADFSNRQFGNKRGVTREDAKIPVLAGNLHFFRHVLHHHLLGRDNLELESITHLSLAIGRWSLAKEQGPTTDDGSCRSYAAFIFSAASSTSSIVPFM